MSSPVPPPAVPAGQAWAAAGQLVEAAVDGATVRGHVTNYAPESVSVLLDGGGVVIVPVAAVTAVSAADAQAAQDAAAASALGTGGAGLLAKLRAAGFQIVRQRP